MLLFSCLLHSLSTHWKTDAEAEVPILKPPYDSLEKALTLGKIEGGRRRGRQDEMVGWHH